MLTFSNPRLRAEFDDWPSGAHRVKCVFQVHRDAKRGWRVSRTTTDRNGNPCKPKLTTFSGPCCVVDGSDGRTYLLRKAGMYEFITVSRSDFMDASIEMDRGSGGASVFPDRDQELHAALAKLIVDSGSPLMTTTEDWHGP